MVEVIMFSLLMFMCFISAIRVLTEYDSVGGCVILIIVGLLVIIPLVHSVKDYKFEKYKTITYSKPAVNILEETDTHIRLLIDNKEVKEFTEHKYYKIDQLYWQIESYKSRTNKDLVYKGE